MTWAPELTLADLAEGSLFTDGNWVESKDQDPAGAVRLTQLADVGVGVFRNRSDRWMRTDQAASLGCTFLRANDILIARMPDPIGRACLVPTTIDTAVTAVDVAILRVARSDVDPRYVMWAINSPTFHSLVVGRQSGTTRKRISRKNLATLTIPIPSFEEQSRIVDLLEDHLSRLDAADQGLANALARSEALLTVGLWHATHGLGEDGPVELQSLAEVRLGRQRSPKNHTGDRMRPYLRAANVGWNTLRLESVKEMQFSEAEEETYRLEVGDILLTEASGSPAEVGKSVRYRGVPADVCFQNTLLRVRCNSADPEFVQKYLLAEARAGRFMPEARGVGINHLGRARLAAMAIQIPTMEEQTAAVAACRELVDGVEQFKATIVDQVKRSVALRKSLLAAAFSGRLIPGASDLSVAGEIIRL